jgi:hypothetical protein
MTDWQVLSVELDPPVAGRGLLRVSRGADMVEFPFSYTPLDSIEALAEAVDAVLSATGERRVVFSSGPEELELVLSRTADRVDIRLLSYRDQRRDAPGEERLAFVLNPRLTGKLFWRALRQLQSRIDETRYEQAWHHLFPRRLVDQLGARLKET